MARAVNLKKGNVHKNGVIGFSWTTLFFGAFVPLFRGDIAWFFIMLIAAACTFGLSLLVFPFIYNKIYTKNLLIKDGFEAADENAERELRVAGIII